MVSGIARRVVGHVWIPLSFTLFASAFSQSVWEAMRLADALQFIPPDGEQAL